MGTTVKELEQWFNEAKKKGATHMVVVCDTFDHDDYPVYVMPGQDPHKVAGEHNGYNMQRVMEVYALHKPFDQQEGMKDGIGRAHDYSMPTNGVSSSNGSVQPGSRESWKGLLEVVSEEPQEDLYKHLLEEYIRQGEVQLATLELMAGKKRTPKNELNRQNLIVESIIQVLRHHRVTVAQAKDLRCGRLADELAEKPSRKTGKK